MTDFARPLKDLLAAYGCEFRLHITVDSKIKSRHTANAVLKQAGIDRKL